MANFDFGSFIERISRTISFGNRQTTENIQKMSDTVENSLKSNINNVNVFRQEAQKNSQNLSSIISTIYSRLDGVKKGNDNISENLLQNNANNREMIFAINNLNSSMNNLVALNNNIISELRSLNNLTASGNKDFSGFFSFFKKNLSASEGAIGGTVGRVGTLGKALGVGALINSDAISGLGSSLEEKKSLSDKGPYDIGFPGGGKLPDARPPSNEAQRSPVTVDPNLKVGEAKPGSTRDHNATAYGHSSVDSTPDTNSNMGKGNRNNLLIPGMSVASNLYPHGTKLRIRSKDGKHIGDFVVHDSGGAPGMRSGQNVDFYAGNDPNLYKYFAGLGKINVEVLPGKGPSIPFKNKDQPDKINEALKGYSVPKGDVHSNFPHLDTSNKDNKLPTDTQSTSGQNASPVPGSPQSSQGGIPGMGSSQGSQGGASSQNKSQADAVKIASTMINKTRKESLDYLAKGGFINRGEAWCAQFVNSTLKQTGITGTGSAVANSFQKWGSAVNPNEVKSGDVVILTRGKGPDEVGGHVGIATGNVQNGKIEIIAGNTRGKVKQYFVPVNSQLMIRRGGEGTQQTPNKEQPTNRTSENIPGTVGESKELSSSNIGTGQNNNLNNMINGILGMIPGGGMIGGLINSIMGGGGIGGLVGSLLGGGKSQNTVSSYSDTDVKTLASSKETTTVPTSIPNEQPRTTRLIDASLMQQQPNLGKMLSDINLQTAYLNQPQPPTNQNQEVINTPNAGYDQKGFFGGSDDWGDIGNLNTDRQWAKKTFEYFQIA